MPPAPRDLLLAPQIAPEVVAQILEAHGLRDVRAADASLQEMARDPLVRTLLADVVGELLFCLKGSPDPDRALARIERFVAASLAPRELFAHLKESPQTLALMTRVFGASAFMAEILTRSPGDLYWVADPAVLEAPRSERTLRRDLSAMLRSLHTEEKRLDTLRLFKRRELLHIGVRDLLRRATVEQTLAALSDLARVLIDAAVTIDGTPRGGLAVIGLGKLGGGELNFSSDVDLLYVHGDTAPADEAERRARRITAALGSSTNEGHVFRVDLRLRPEGRVGRLTQSIPGLRRYYAERGRTWERLALLKASPVGGDRRLGRRFVDAVREFVYLPPFDDAAFAAVRHLKAQVDAGVDARGETATNVKLGRGGIREIEFVVQALQARFGRDDRRLRVPGTLAALAALAEAGHVPAPESDVLRRAYIFLRDVENKLQMASDAQVHTMPADEAALVTLARTLGYGEDGGAAAVRGLHGDMARHRDAVHAIFDSTFPVRDVSGAVDPGPPPEE